MKCKCGREIEKEEDCETGGCFYTCKGCGIWMGNCKCKPLDVPPLDTYTKKKA